MKTQFGLTESPAIPANELTDQTLKVSRGLSYFYRLAVAAIATVAAATVLPLSAQTFLFDFGGGFTTGHGPSPDDPIGYWNNVTADIGGTNTGRLLNLVNSQNVTSTISLFMISRFNGVNENGTVEPTQFPSDATRDSLFGNTEIFNGLTNIFPSFKLTGLEQQNVYDLTFYASRMGVTDNRETGYTITGAGTAFAALNAANNINGVVTVSNVAPSAAGEITISLAPTENNNNGSHFTYLGVLKVETIPPQAPITFTLEPVSQRVAEFEPVTFTSAVQGPPPYFIQWYSNGVVIPGANQFSYTIPSTTTNMSGSQFSVTVSNQLFGAASSNAVLRVINDTNPPTVISAIGLDGFTIELVFSEPMDPGSATDAFSYVVNGGVVSVGFIVLGPDGRTVTLNLTTGAPISGNFILILGGQSDLSLNPIPIGTEVNGRVLGVEDQSFLFDFGGANTTERGPSPDDPTNNWNNVTATVGTAAGNQLTALVTTRNISTPLGLTIISRFNGANENGVTVSGIFPTDATRDSLFGNTELFGPLENVFPSFKLTGVPASVTYKLTFFASRTGVGDNRETGYTVNGATTGFAALNAANNVANVAVVSGMRADANGEITVSLAPTANNNNANHFTYLGVMRLDPMPPELRLRPPTIQNGQVTLEWTGNGQLEWAPNITGPWTTLPSATTPHTESLEAGANRFYRLKANP